MTINKIEILENNMKFEKRRKTTTNNKNIDSKNSVKLDNLEASQ
ncbi:14537_t:CDS:1, partial [Cetraspora pellucida]